jgi:hypothetical protein
MFTMLWPGQCFAAVWLTLRPVSPHRVPGFQGNSSTSDPLVPNSRIEKSPSDMEQVGVIPRPNVHAALVSFQAFSVDTERHQVASSDPDRDGPVTTQTTTQAPSPFSPGIHFVLLAEGCLPKCPGPTRLLSIDPDGIRAKTTLAHDGDRLGRAFHFLYQVQSTIPR